jgi:heme/copper-type cytochrome/quinol oxidase subunit 2
LRTPTERFLLFKCLPLLIAFLCGLFWQSGSDSIGLLTLLLDFLVVPAYLIIICHHFVIVESVSLFIAIPVSLVVNVIGIYIHYWNYNSSLRNTNSPDATSKMMLQIQLIVSLLILIIGMVIIVFKKLKSKH